jgi:hypothetical protein
MNAPSFKDAKQVMPHTLFIRPDCQYCKLFVQQLDNSELKSLVNIVNVQTTPVDPRQIHAVPAIVVSQQMLYVGRDAFAWLVNEVKKTLEPAICAYSGSAMPASIDGADVCSGGYAPRDYVPEHRPMPSEAVMNEPIETRLARLKQERGT